MRSKATWQAHLGLVCAVFFPPVVLAAAPSDTTDPAPAEESGVIVIRAERLVVRPGEVLSDVSVLVRDGRIVEVGSDIALPEGATEVSGKVVCASFIDPWSALGVDGGVLSDRKLVEAARIADSLDLHANDHLREEALRAGVTSVRLQGGWQGGVCGLGAVVRLDPTVDDPKQAVLLGDADLGMSVGLSVDQGMTFRRMPDGSFQIISGDRAIDVFDRVSAVERVVSSIETGRAYRRSEIEYKYEFEEWQKSIAEKVEELEKDFKKAKKDRDKKLKEAEEKGKEYKEKKYKEDKKPRRPKFDENKAMLARVAEGELPLVVEIHRAAEIRNLLKGTEQFGRLRLVLAGGSEAMYCAKELSERGVSVIVWPSLRGTGANDEFSGDDLSLAASLSAAGVKVLLGTGGRNSTSTRDLPLLAELAVGHGLAREEAFEALTLGAARTFDVADRLGSVEVGKDADLLVLDGLPLEPNTTVQYVLCGGRLAVSPENN
jgi:imidazolonepropionase-like amidohydrolase